jgi:hypothetical protein
MTKKKKGPFILKQLWRYSVVFIFLGKKKKIKNLILVQIANEIQTRKLRFRLIIISFLSIFFFLLLW